MERARGILAKARATLANERIWMKSALVERERGETEEVPRRPTHAAGCTVSMRPGRLSQRGHQVAALLRARFLQA